MSFPMDTRHKCYAKHCSYNQTCNLEVVLGIVLALQSTNDLYQVCVDRRLLCRLCFMVSWQTQRCCTKPVWCQTCLLKPAVQGTVTITLHCLYLHGFMATREMLHKTWYLMPSKSKQVFIKASSTGDCYHYAALSLLYGFMATRETLHKTWHLMPSKS